MTFTKVRLQNLKIFATDSLPKKSWKLTKRLQKAKNRCCLFKALP